MLTIYDAEMSGTNLGAQVADAIVFLLHDALSLWVSGSRYIRSMGCFCWVDILEQCIGSIECQCRLISSHLS